MQAQVLITDSGKLDIGLILAHLPFYLLKHLLSCRLAVSGRCIGEAGVPVARLHNGSQQSDYKIDAAQIQATSGHPIHSTPQDALKKHQG